MVIVPQSGSYEQLPLFPEMPSKRCRKCLIVYPLTIEYWSPEKRTKSGFASWCRECVREANRQLRARKLDEYHERDRLYHTNNRDSRLDRLRRQRREKPNHVHERDRRYRQTETYRKNRRQIRKRRNARKRGATGSHTAAEIQALYEQQRGKCFHCGVEFNGVYTEDHVIPLSRGGGDFIENIVLMCVSCNSSKGSKLLHEWCPERYREE